MNRSQNPNSYALQRKLIINQLDHSYTMSNSDKYQEDYIHEEKGWEMPEVGK